MANFSSWAQIYTIRSLFLTTNTTATQGIIYGNGLNQAEVLVHMVAVDSQQHEITGIPTSALIQNSTLIDYITGATIDDASAGPSPAGDNVWSFSLTPNGFNFAPPANYYTADVTCEPDRSTAWHVGGNDEPQAVDARYPAAPDANQEFMARPDLPNAAAATYFVMRGPNAATRTKQFAVKVTLTHPEAPITVFSTGFNGTEGFTSYVTLTALDPIDYSYPENRIVRETEPAIMSRSIYYQLYSEYYDTYTEHGGQVSRRHTLVISPAIGGKFHTVEDMSGLLVNDNYVNQGGMPWQDQSIPGFTGLQAEYPVSILGRSPTIYQNYRMNFWYLHPDNARFVGHCIIRNDSSWDHRFYRFFTHFDESQVYETPDPGRLVCYQFEIDVYNLFNWQWRYVERENLILRLTDRYGNRGFVSLVFNLGEWFDRPRIV